MRPSGRICRRIVELVIAGSLAGGSASGTVPASPPEHPRDFHHRLRILASAGTATTRLVHEWESRRADYSFSSFSSEDPRFRRAVGDLLSAIRLEADGQPAPAASLYRQTAARLVSLGARSEASFCLLHAAELAQAEGRLESSLSLLDEALKLLDKNRPQPYLEATLLQGRGYALWFLDQLQPAIQAFAEALERFQTLSLREGIVATWNNLAVLHEELLHPESAREAYHRALEMGRLQVSPAVEFQLNSNMASFLARFGAPGEPAPFLERARQLREQDPFEFLLLECRVGKRPSCPALESFPTDRPAQEIERLLVLARLTPDLQTRRQSLSHALGLARQMGSPYWIRKATLELGESLEEVRSFAESARLYRETWELERDLFEKQAVYYPYQRALAPLFSGRIRSLIRARRWDQAWREIQEFSWRRQQRIASIQSPASTPAPLEPDPGGDPALQAAQRAAAGDFPRQPGPEFLPPQPEGFAVIELWPDGHDLFAWLFAGKTRTFHSCKLSDRLQTLLEESVGPLYRTRQVLPSLEPLERLRTLYETCFLPLESAFEMGRVLVIPHAEMQSLPLELLSDGKGFLGNRVAFSYLPRWQELEQQQDAVDPPHLVHRGFTRPPEAAWLEPIDTRLRIVRELPRTGQDPIRAPWIHISSHFSLRPENWLASELGDREPIPIEEFLTANFQCHLLSLGMCDGGKNAAGSNPYWMGLAEILLQRRTRALVLSRWQLDDFSLEIYRRFYENLRSGVSADRALQRARLEFSRQWLVRSGSRQSAGHPFFWAGISYVGHPDDGFPAGATIPAAAGNQLPPAGWKALLLLWGGLLLRILHGRRQATPPAHTPVKVQTEPRKDTASFRIS